MLWTQIVLSSHVTCCVYSLSLSLNLNLSSTLIFNMVLEPICSCPSLATNCFSIIVLSQISIFWQNPQNPVPLKSPWFSYLLPPSSSIIVHRVQSTNAFVVARAVTSRNFEPNHSQTCPYTPCLVLVVCDFLCSLSLPTTSILNLPPTNALNGPRTTASRNLVPIRYWTCQREPAHQLSHLSNGLRPQIGKAPNFNNPYIYIYILIAH